MNMDMIIICSCFSCREYEKLKKVTVRRKMALRQQKTLIKSYMKSVQLRGKNFEEVGQF
jgi:hypothetical protein